VVHLRQCHAVSYERLASVLDVQFGVQLSEGALASMLKAAAGVVHFLLILGYTGV
jgi:hypothetical protein